MSKEMDNMIDAINKWVKKHKGKVQFVGSFMAFKGKEFDIFDDRVFAFGPKECLELDLKDTLKMVKKEKEDFVNW